MGNLKERINRLFRTGFFHIFGSSVINKVISFISSVVIVRILTKPEYGTFTYAWNIYSIVFLFNGMGIESGVLQLSSEHSGDLKYASKVYNYGTRFGLKFNLLLLIVLLGIGFFAPLKINGGRKLLISLCLLPMCSLLYGLNSVYLRSQKRNQEFARIQVIHSMLLLVTSLSMAFILREMGLVAGHYIANIVTCIFAVYVFRIRLVCARGNNLGDDTKVLLKISFISMLNNGLSSLLSLLDVFVLGIVDPQETILASYKVATMIPMTLSFIPLALVTYLYPYFAEHKDDGKWCIRKYRQILIYFGSFNLLLSTVLFICAPYIIRIVFGDQYSDAVTVFRLLSASYFFSGTFRVISGNLLITQRKLKVNLAIAIISSVTNAIADFFFIQWWGATGAALATILVVFVSSLLSTVYLIYSFRVKISEERIN